MLDCWSGHVGPWHSGMYHYLPQFIFYRETVLVCGPPHQERKKEDHKVCFQGTLFVQGTNV